MTQESKWDQRYGEPGFAYGTAPNAFLVSAVHHLPPAGDVLCLAEGEGRNSVFLAQQGYTVTAVDSSAVGLQKAQALAAKNRTTITTKVADLSDYTIPTGSCAGIISIFCHLPQPLRKQVHEKVVNGLTPGGVLILEGYTPRQLELKTGGPPDKSLLMELEEIKEELTGLEFLHAVETEREIIEGRLHTGIGAVIQIIGKKV
jgi:SAM-dependent methyltransferase